MWRDFDSTAVISHPCPHARRRALERIAAVRELLAFLEVADNKFKLGMTTQICLAAKRLAPNKQQHIDTVLRVLKRVGGLVFCPFCWLTSWEAGDYVREEILSAFIRLVMHTPELQHYTVEELFWRSRRM